jgi:hypothetical protein
MTLYIINNYTIGVIMSKDNIIILVKDNNNNNKYTMKINESIDCCANTNCENNIRLQINSSIRDLIINCLEKKPFYNIYISKDEYTYCDDTLDFNFSFKYENFDFSYNLTLYIE